MNVALDVNGIYTGRAGVARYLRGLQQGFSVLGDPGVRVMGLAWAVPNHDFKQPQRALNTLYRERVWTHLEAPAALRRGRADLLHVTSVPGIRSLPELPRVATLFDLAPLRQPDRFRPWHRASFGRFVAALSQARRVICISRFTADEALRLLPLEAARLEVVHCGGVLPIPECEGMPAPMPPTPPEFMLFVGSLEPGKNLALLREVYRLARSRGQQLPPLVILGARWQGVSGEGAPPPDWHYLGWQPDSVLQALYTRAMALVFPTRYEGFGLPVLEAMAAGCPVICSPVASLPEVAGDAACYAALEPESYLEAMRELADHAARRRMCISRGLVRAAAFSWPACAAGTRDVYRSALRGAESR